MINLRFSACFLVIAISMLATSCKTSFEEIKYSDGNANFSRFVAIGSGNFAGYSDNALYAEAQAASVPAILASRFALVGGGNFFQPDVTPGVGIGLDSNARLVLKNALNPCIIKTDLRVEPLAPQGDLSNFNSVYAGLPFNNLSVPDARMHDLTRQSFGDPSPFLGNPFYARFASNPSTSTIAGDALLANPTFVAVWMGMDDIYDYAVTGGDGGGDSVTSVATFTQLYSNMIQELTSQNEGGVLLNIPSLNTIPFFSAVKWNGLELDATRAAQLTALYTGIGSPITFTAGNNAFVIADSDVASGFRQIKSNEYVLLSVSRDSILCNGLGATVPIPESRVLDASEVAAINAAISAYNNVIFNEAFSRGLAYADINKLFNTLEPGIRFNGAEYTIEYLFGGAFSLDGYHLSQRGSALVANEVLSTINRHYSAKIPFVDVNSYPGIVFP